jgi:prevent-host-death family protein
MQVSVTDAKGQLTELVRRAEAGDEVILTRHGQPAVRLVAIHAPTDRVTRRKVMEAVQKAGAARAIEGVSAERSQDFLYDDDGLPK